MKHRNGLVGHGYAAVGTGTRINILHFQFYADGKVYSKVRGQPEFILWDAEPVFLDSLMILDFDVFEKYFSHWDD